jgi:transposase InsO family protein
LIQATGLGVGDGVEVRAITDHWLQKYNTIRPHEALHGLTPHQYAIQHA